MNNKEIKKLNVINSFDELNKEFFKNNIKNFLNTTNDISWYPIPSYIINFDFTNKLHDFDIFELF